jgi:hypothetical protein
MTVVRDPAAAGKVVWGWSGAVGAGQQAVVEPNDALVFFQNGMLLGVLGPGRHTLTAGAVPFLAMASPADLRLFFVRTETTVQIAGPLGSLTDRSGASARPLLKAALALRTSDPGRVVMELAGTAADPAEAIEAFLRQTVTTAARPAVDAIVAERGSLAAAGDPAAAAGIAAAAERDAAARLAGFGIEIAITSLAFEGLPGVAAAPAGPSPAPAGVRVAGQRTYEMMWDCPHCGTKKNLGLTHRHCPSCGAPQDAKLRYFPADAEKVAVEDHQYVGADVKCLYCEKYSSRKANNCGGCGAPLEGAEAAARRADQVGKGVYGGETVEQAMREHRVPGLAPVPPGGPAPVPPKKGSSKTKWIALGCLGAVLVACLIGGVFAFWKREGSLEVAGHSWVREIQVQRFGPVDESSWCDSMPGDAQNVRRSREQRSTRRVPDGESCQTRRIDNGDGTYSEREECTPRYRQEPVYDDKCYYRVDRWALARTERATGASLAEEPQWPAVSLARTGQCIGCEREGPRSETYTVLFREQSGEESRCTFPQAQWASYAPGSRWKGDLTVVGDVLDCESLRAE